MFDTSDIDEAFDNARLAFRDKDFQMRRRKFLAHENIGHLERTACLVARTAPRLTASRILPPQRGHVRDVTSSDLGASAGGKRHGNRNRKRTCRQFLAIDLDSLDGDFALG